MSDCKVWCKIKILKFGTEIWKNCCHIWNQHPQICLFAKFHKKIKMPKLGPKMPALAIFKLKVEKNNAIFETSTLKFAWMQNFAENQKCLNLRPKMPYLSIFDQKYPIWVFLGKNFQNAIASSIDIVVNGPVFNLFFFIKKF